MVYAIHFINERTPTGFKYLIRLDDGNYRTGYWLLSPEEASSLRGGWVYLHETKKQPSGFGGRIFKFELEPRPNDPLKQGFVFTFTPDEKAKNVKWRGQDHTMAWTGRLIGADLPHEKADPK